MEQRKCPGGSVPLDQSHFPDDLFRRLVKRFDVDGDGALSPEECRRVREIDCADQLIEDLTGLDVFSELEVLDCSGTGIVHLDVRENRMLRSLDCSGTGLKELDVSQNGLLTELWCSETFLKELDVSANQQLEWLWCDGTALTRLDVRGNPRLVEVVCDEIPVSTCDDPPPEILYR